jgi:YVTN family beta-propeller protein
MIKKSNINIMRMVAISIVLLFLISGFSAMAHGSVPKSSISSSGMSGNIYRGSITPSVQNSTQNNSGGYVKYTLDLMNNTLINGNFVDRNNGIFPFGAAFDSANGYIYVTNPNSKNVSVISGSTNKVIACIGVGSEPYGAAFDSANGYIYVTNANSNNVSVINGATNKVIASIGVGSSPYGAAFDSANGYIYVTNFGSGTVSIISTPSQVMKQYSVTFTESGLPSGTTWSVTLNGTTESSTTDTITFSVPNGTYSYSIGSVSGYTASNLNGSVTVNGNNIPISITFSSTSPLAKQPSSGISRIELYGIIGAVVAIAAIGSAIALVRKRK